MTQHPLITVTGARRRYGSFEAVRGVDLSVGRGELVALLGTNGAGKTSLLELIEGLAPASGGTIRVLGRDPYRERSRVIARLGIMLQEAGFAGDLTVAETARMWAGTQTAPRPYRAALEIVGLGHRADVRVLSLSGGERRRLDLALAIMGRPEVLFLDEPTTGLDPASRRATWDLVRDLVADGTTVLLTTHYLEEAEELADRLAIMHGGRIVAEGTVAEIVASEPARLEFELVDSAGRPVPDAASRLPALTVRGDVSRGRVRLRTDALQDDLTTLLVWAREHGMRLAGLDARAASLEQAFLAISQSPSSPDAPDTPETPEKELVA